MKPGQKISDREKQKRIIVRIEGAYMTENRRSTYTALEEVDMLWDLKQALELDRLWNEGLSIEQLSERFKRSVDDIEILVKDRIKKGKIDYRTEREKTMLTKSAMYTSNTDEWATDPLFYALLDRYFNFNLDPCATHENHKCDKYFTRAEDGLAQSWEGHRVYMNPPYGEPEYPCKKKCVKKKCQKRGYHIDKYEPGVIDWMKKAYEESKKGTLIVCLVPTRPDTKWWNYARKADYIVQLPGRLKFVGAKDSAPFPSALVVYTGNPILRTEEARMIYWDHRQELALQ